MAGLQSFWMCQAMIAWLWFRDSRASVIAVLASDTCVCRGLICVFF